MDISVIVPIYGTEAYIERCLRSLFTQSKTDGVEFILVNDCTKDRSMEIAREVIAEFPYLTVRIIEHSENRHVAATRQTGLDAAVGEYTIQIDSDDWCEPTMLEDMYNKAIATDADIVYCDIKVDEAEKIQINCTNNIECISLLVVRTHSFEVSLCNKLIRRSLYLENDIKIDCGINMGEDQLVVIKLFYHAKKIVYLLGVYYNYCNNNTNNSITNSYNNRFEDDISCIDLISSYLKEKKLYNKLARKVTILKASRKITAIRGSRGERQKRYVKIYPEVDSLVLGSDFVPITTKIPLFLLRYKMQAVANLIFNLSDFYNKNRNRKLV